MNGKDLVIVMVVAGAAGAAAAFATTLVNPPALPTGDGDLTARLDRIETALARAAEDRKAENESVAKLNERITGLQIDVNRAREESSAASGAEADAPGGVAARPGRARPRILDGTDQKPVQIEGGTFTLGDPSGGVVLGSRGEFTTGALRGRFESLTQGMRLRALPEADRWKKAQDEVHLTDAQVEGLKRAVADRDAAIKEAMQVETTTDANGTMTGLTFRRMDPLKAAAANDDYQKKVTDTLDADQEKTWKEKGYDHAFGGGTGMTSVVISASSIDLHSSELKKDK